MLSIERSRAPHNHERYVISFMKPMFLTCRPMSKNIGDSLGSRTLDNTEGDCRKRIFRWFPCLFGHRCESPPRIPFNLRWEVFSTRHSGLLPLVTLSLSHSLFFRSRTVSASCFLHETSSDEQLHIAKNAAD